MVHKQVSDDMPSESAIARLLDMNTRGIFCFFTSLSLVLAISSVAQNRPVRLTPVDTGWSNNSVNVTVFRKNSLASLKDTQFIAFYSPDRHVVIGKRKVGADKWELIKTQFTGRTTDAHNVISIAVDGDGYLHMAWDHHNTQLRYCKSRSPFSLDVVEQPMTGIHEDKVTYPEFFRLPSGDLLFLYRDGSSGNGNLVLKNYSIKSRQWEDVQSSLIDGEGQRNAYWQAWVDGKGAIHVSWVWRESPDVASNHDLCYAISRDGGVTWHKSTGEKYKLPITESAAEYVARIDQRHELINQTSMTADENGNPVIATYWRDEDSTVPQYKIVFRHQGKWMIRSLDNRKQSFSLSGGGTKRIPISRPQVLASSNEGVTSVFIVFRDAERANVISVAKYDDVVNGMLSVTDIYGTSVGQWEPTYDIDLWKTSKVLNLFVQNVEQLDGEGTASVPGTLVRVLKWHPLQD